MHILSIFTFYYDDLKKAAIKKVNGNDIFSTQWNNDIYQQIAFYYIFELVLTS